MSVYYLLISLVICSLGLVISALLVMEMQYFIFCRVWVSNKVTKSFPLSASRTYSSAFALRQRMLNFIQNIEYYMMFEVIERNWQNFINKMQKVWAKYFLLDTVKDMSSSSVTH